MRDPHVVATITQAMLPGAKLVQSRVPVAFSRGPYCGCVMQVNRDAHRRLMQETDALAVPLDADGESVALYLLAKDGRSAVFIGYGGRKCE